MARIDITLRELIQGTTASARLGNASLAQVFETTVADFLAKRQETLEELRKERNIGSTTIRELELVVDKYLAEQPDGDDARAVSPRNERVSEEDSRLAGLPREIAGITLRTLVTLVGASARLANAASREGFFQETDVRSFLLEHSATLPKLPNLGRTSVAELAALVRDYVDCAERILEAITGGADQPAAGFAASADTTDKALTAIFSTLASRRLAPTGDIGLLPVREGVIAAVSALPKNGSFVVRRRYGLEGFRPMTLNEIADEGAVTRERVRQVEAKALQRLRVGAGEVFARLLRESAAAIWTVLSGGRAVATAESIAVNRGRLEPLHRLAIDVIHESEEGWVASQALRTERGWRRGPPEPPSTAGVDLGERLRKLAFPRPMDDTAATLGLNVAGLEEALENAPEVRCLDGFVHTGFVGARARRAVALYRLATQEGFPRPFDIQTLAQRHREQFPNDAVASRMVLKELQEHPHLFVHGFDSLWLPLPFDGEQWLYAASAAPLPFDRLNMMDDGGFEEGSIGRMLVEHMARRGPQRLGDLQDVAVAHGHASGTSVGPILLMNPCFQRVLPGTYGLYARSTEEQVEATLSVSQCRHFAFARYGGAPRDFFPLWSASYEQRLCRWARFQAPTDIFRSLMFVASPEDWVIPGGQLAEWLEVKERHAAWSIGSARRDDMDDRLPSPEAFFSALSLLVLTGSTCWLTVNRCAQQKVDSQEAAEILTLMVGAGLVKAPGDWQGAHPCTPSSRAVLESLAGERWRTGTLAWSGGGLAELVRSATERILDTEMGWVDRGELLVLLRVAQEDNQPEEQTPQESNPKDDGLNELLQSDEWSKLFDS